MPTSLEAFSLRYRPAMCTPRRCRAGSTVHVAAPRARRAGPRRGDPAGGRRAADASPQKIARSRRAAPGMLGPGQATH
jgi:hypothetical protein